MSLDDALFRVEATGINQLVGGGLAVGDFTGDARPEVAVGAIKFSQPQTEIGLAAVLVGDAPRSGVVSIDEADILIHGEFGGDRLGQGLVIGDLDGDGDGDLLVGAQAASGAAGRVYLFDGSLF